MLNYLEDVKSMFYHYGFTDCPLDDMEVVECFYKGLDYNQTYNVGCDVNSGFSFEESLKENY